VKTSDMVGLSGQVPDMGAVGQIAPQLFEMSPGAISGPINGGRTGVVAKLLLKEEPSPDDIAKNLDQTREQILEQRRSEAFEVFANNIISDYKKHNRVRVNAKQTQLPGE
jgi:peptidyl-prolyl cis-trans isomerase D